MVNWLFGDYSDEYQWHARCAIDITIRFYCSMLTGVLIAIEWLIVGTSIFGDNETAWVRAQYYNLISMGVELIYYFCVFMVDYKVQKVLAWEKLHSILTTDKTYRNKFSAWFLVTLSLQFLIFLFSYNDMIGKQ